MITSVEENQDLFIFVLNSFSKKINLKDFINIRDIKVVNNNDTGKP